MNIEQIKIHFNRGQMSLEEIAWLIQEVQRLQVVEQAYKGMRLAK